MCIYICLYIYVCLYTPFWIISLTEYDNTFGSSGSYPVDDWYQKDKKKTFNRRGYENNIGTKHSSVVFVESFVQMKTLTRSKRFKDSF